MVGPTRKALVLGASAVAGGWGGRFAMAKLGARFGLGLGPMGSVAGAAIGALLGIGLARMLVDDASGDIEGEFEVEREEAA